MNAQPVEKTCNTCGRNVADLPRTKDTSGRYFCNPCWSQRVSQARSSAKPAVPADPVADPYDLAALATISTRPDLFDCDDCRGTFRNADVCFEDGEIVCRKCLAKRPPKAIPPAIPAAQPPAVVASGPAKVNMQIFSLCISMFVVVLCALAVFPVFVDSKSSEDAKLTSAVVGLPIGAMFAWTAFEAMRGRATIHHKLTLPVAVIVCCLTFRTILDNADKSSRSGSNSPEATEQDAREGRVAAFDREHAKAEHMRERGWNGPDDALANTYDRIKSDDDAKRFREHELGN